MNILKRIRKIFEKQTNETVEHVKRVERSTKCDICEDSEECPYKLECTSCSDTRRHYIPGMSCPK